LLAGSPTHSTRIQSPEKKRAPSSCIRCSNMLSEHLSWPYLRQEPGCSSASGLVSPVLRFDALSGRRLESQDSAGRRAVVPAPATGSGDRVHDSESDLIERDNSRRNGLCRGRADERGERLLSADHLAQCRDDDSHSRGARSGVVHAYVSLLWRRRGRVVLVFATAHSCAFPMTRLRWSHR
jgi:hypothetical protein